MKRLILSVFLLLIVDAIPALSQIHEPFQHLTVANGLSQNSVFAIYDDRKGFLWFGTGDGLNKYDGYSFTIYKNRAADSTSLTPGTVRSIFEDRNGTLWVGTDLGLSRFDRNHGTFRQYRYKQGVPHGLPGNNINALHEDEQGNLWIATGGGLAKYVGEEKFEVFTFAETGGYNSITSLLGEEEKLWVGTFDGLRRFDLVRETFDPLLWKGDVRLSSYVRALWNARFGGLVAGMANRFIVVRGNDGKHTRREQIQLEHEVSFAAISSIGETENIEFLVGTYGDGLYVLDQSGKTLAHLRYDASNPQSLGSNLVTKVFRDKAGIFWVGTDGAGVSILNPHLKQFRHVRRMPESTNGPAGNFVKAILEDRKGVLWIGTVEHGLSSFDPKTKKWRHYSTHSRSPLRISGNSVFALLEDSHGELWIGTDRGLDRFDRHRQRSWHSSSHWLREGEAVSRRINSLYEDSRGTLWVGTDGELSRLHRETNALSSVWNRVDTNTYGLGNITCFAEDKNGILWAGSLGFGLTRCDWKRNVFRHYMSESTPGLASNRIRSLLLDSVGILWIGSEQGLVRFDPQSEKAIVLTEEDGLANGFIYQILSDDRGNLWISTNGGLSKFTESAPVVNSF